MKRYLAIALLWLMRFAYGITVWLVWSALMGAAVALWLILHALALVVGFVSLLRRAAQTPKD